MLRKSKLHKVPTCDNFIVYCTCVSWGPTRMDLCHVSCSKRLCSLLFRRFSNCGHIWANLCIYPRELLENVISLSTRRIDFPVILQIGITKNLQLLFSTPTTQGQLCLAQTWNKRVAINIVGDIALRGFQDLVHVVHLKRARKSVHEYAQSPLCTYRRVPRR